MSSNHSRRSVIGALLAATVIPLDLHARGGCGSRGGPGYRKANGQCAGWNDYQEGHETAAPRSSLKSRPQPRLTSRSAQQTRNPTPISRPGNVSDDICEPNSTCAAELKAQAEFNRVQR